MREASNGLLVSRILVLQEKAHAVLRVELASTCGTLDPESDPRNLPVAILRADELVQLAQGQAVDGILLVGHRSALGRSGLPGLLRQLRPQYGGWLGLEITGPEPEDLRAVLGTGLLNYVDVQLAWVETDPDTREETVQVVPSLRQIVGILQEARCSCVIRFTQPAEEERFNEVSSAFDAFVRVSAEPVAVQVVDRFEEIAQAGACTVGQMEFIACRPAWLVRQSQGQWYQVQPEAQGLPQAKRPEVGPRRRGRPLV